MIPFLVEMKAIHDETQAAREWQNDDFDPPTISWNIGINDHTRAVNITPPQSVCTVYFRPMPGQQVDGLIERARSKAAECGMEFDLRIKASAMYVDPESDYIGECLKLADRQQPQTVAYGTDGAMFWCASETGRLRSRLNRPGAHARRVDCPRATRRGYSPLCEDDQALVCRVRILE